MLVWLIAERLAFARVVRRSSGSAARRVWMELTEIIQSPFRINWFNFNIRNR
jgi:hypothetical protein